MGKGTLFIITGLILMNLGIKAEAQTLTWSQVQGPYGGNVNKITSHSNGTV